jgi:hypothetical protein
MARVISTPGISCPHRIVTHDDVMVIRILMTMIMIIIITIYQAISNLSLSILRFVTLSRQTLREFWFLISYLLQMLLKPTFGTPAGITRIRKRNLKYSPFISTSFSSHHTFYYINPSTFNFFLFLIYFKTLLTQYKYTVKLFDNQ